MKRISLLWLAYFCVIQISGAFSLEKLTGTYGGYLYSSGGAAKKITEATLTKDPYIESAFALFIYFKGQEKFGAGDEGYQYYFDGLANNLFEFSYYHGSLYQLYSIGKYNETQKNITFSSKSETYSFRGKVTQSGKQLTIVTNDFNGSGRRISSFTFKLVRKN